MQIKSIFEQISSQVFSMTNLNEAKSYVIEFVSNKSIKEEDKKSILAAVNEAKSLTRFQTYICNSLLKYEGMGMNQLEKKKD